MTIRTFMLGAAALLLTACGGEEYPVPASEAASLLAGLGNAPAVSPMPAALSDVVVNFESLPGGKAVQWSFTHNGDDLAKIVATVEPKGVSASIVTLDYVEGSAPDAKSNASKIRDQLRGGVRQLLLEAVDSTLDHRPFDMALRQQVDTNITVAMIGTMFQGASDGMDAAMARTDLHQQPSQSTTSSSIPSPQEASKPTTDLSQFR